MYVLGNYSRFVRPGFYRIGVSNNAVSLVSAYKDDASGSFAIVAANTGGTTVTQTFNLKNFTPGTVTPWVTSSNLSLASQPVVSVSGSSFSYALPPLSIVTFAGQLLPPNTALTLSPVADQTINAGVPLAITNRATDPDVPPQVLTFSLISNPPNATLTVLDPTHAVFGWRPLVSQAGTTNLVTIQVADNATPSLSATQSFRVTVNPLAQPTVSSISVSDGQVTLVVNGATGPDYTLWASTNLLDWQVMVTSNSPAPPFSLIDTNFGDSPTRFYRIQLGP
jgi:hypothetical protein